MLDFVLEYELVILAIIALLIAWLMGRSLCKSREFQIHSDLKKQERENKRLEAVISRLDQDLHNAYDNTKAEQQKFLNIRQQHEVDMKLYEHLKVAHEKNLQHLQTLESSRIRLQELGKHHEEQSAEYLGLKNTLHQTRVELQDSRNQCNQYKHELERFRQDNEQLRNDYDAQVRMITSLKHRLEKNEENVRGKEQGINELQHHWTMEKNKGQQLATAYDEQTQSNSVLKKSLREIQEVLEETQEANNKLQRELKHSQQENSTLKTRVMSYEILSTIR